MKTSLFAAEMASAIEYMNNGTRQKLFSYTCPLELGQAYNFLNAYDGFCGKKFYWKSNADAHVMVGLDVAKTFSSPSSENRFQDINRQWTDVLTCAEVNNPTDVAGTGPLLFGGFSFDPLSIKEREWEAFGHSLFFLPRYMLTMIHDEAYLTVNLICGGENGEAFTDAISVEVEDLLATKEKPFQEVGKIIASKEVGAQEWLCAVDDVIRTLKESDMNKVVMARRLEVDYDSTASSTFVLDRLLKEQPTSYVFAMETGDGCFLGASPERLIYKRQDYIQSACVAGSIGRSPDVIEDEKLGQTLLNDPKNLYEHQLVVSMIKEAISPCCDEVNIPDQPDLLRIRDIQHLFTPVSGKVKIGTSIIDIVEALHPTPAMGGVPTEEAMAIIRDKENMDRGFYASPLGWMDYRENGEFIVAIRSGLLQGNKAILYAGCGLVADSVPEAELVETRIKFRPMLRAAGGEIK